MLNRADTRKFAADQAVGSSAGMLPSFNLADADRAYPNYVENCRRLGADPLPWDRVQALMSEWSDAMAAHRSRSR